MNRKYNNPYLHKWGWGNNPQDSFIKKDERVLPFLAGALIAGPLWGLGRTPNVAPYPYPTPYPYPAPYPYPVYPYRYPFYNMPYAYTVQRRVF